MSLSLRTPPDPPPNSGRLALDGSSLASSGGGRSGDTYGQIFRLASALTQWCVTNRTSRQPEGK